MLAFLAAREEFAHMPPFDYRVLPNKVTGVGDTKTTAQGFQFMHVGLVICLTSLVLFLVSTALACALLMVGIGVSIFGQVRQGVGADDLHTCFDADFSSGDLHWSSDDEEHWKPVRTFFEEWQASQPR